MLNLLALVQDAAGGLSVDAAKNINGLLGAGIGMGLAVIGGGIGWAASAARWLRHRPSARGGR
jgi:hypothetical protein